MIGLTRKTDYGLVALSCLARRWNDGDGAISARAIAHQFGMPLPQLMNILKKLAAAGMLQSQRGASGGYELARAPEQITLLQVVVVMEGPVRFAACCDGCAELAGSEACPIESHCPIRLSIRRIHHRITCFLNEQTLANLLEDGSKRIAGSASVTLDLDLAATMVMNGRNSPICP